MANTRKRPGTRAKKHFDPELANRMLPLVRAVAADVMRQWRVVRDLNERLGTIPDDDGDTPSVYRDEVRQERQHHREELQKLRGYIEELTQLGLETRNAGRGFVHFPALIDGEEVHLCWKLGEEEVLYWHDTRADCDSRRSLIAGSAADSHGQNESALQDGSLAD